MKFRELPEGYYFIHAVTSRVSVERLENPENAPKYLTETYATTKVVRDGRQYHKNGEPLDNMEVEFKTHEEMQKERKARGARYGHIKRCLNKNKPLTGSMLEIALSLVGDGTQENELDMSIVNKLKAGQPLSEYELHIMTDVRLLHARLS